MPRFSAKDCRDSETSLRSFTQTGATSVNATRAWTLRYIFFARQSYLQMKVITIFFYPSHLLVFLPA